MKTRSFAAAATCAAVAVLLAACGSSTTTNSAATPAQSSTIDSTATPAGTFAPFPGLNEPPAPTAEDKKRTTDECEQAIDDQKLQSFPSESLTNHDEDTASPNWTFFKNISVDRMVLGNDTPGGPDVDQFIVSGRVQAHDAANTLLIAVFECSLPVGNEVPPKITHWTVE